MAYNEFAYFYDELNGEADYDALYTYIKGQLDAHGVADGILADLGCGTGDLTLMLTQAGYDMIGVDQSEEMLAVLREKADELGVSDRLLLLRQDILDLDLFGTIRGAVSTFDTYNHIGPAPRFERAIARAAFFMEEGGVFLFDLNTPYKHAQVLAGQSFDLDAGDALCRWTNRYDAASGRVDLYIDVTDRETGERWQESFSEYSYPLDTVTALLDRYGFTTVRTADGEPIMLENNFFPYEPFKDLLTSYEDLTNASLFDYLERHYGRRPTSTTSCTLEIVRASAEQASFLDIITGDPMFYMNAYFLDGEGRPLVIGRQYIVGSRFVFNI